MNNTQYLEAIDSVRGELERITSEYLRRFGWIHGCDNPASYWLWSKEIDGRVYVVEGDLAVKIQARCAN